MLLLLEEGKNQVRVRIFSCKNEKNLQKYLKISGCLKSFYLGFELVEPQKEV